MSEIHLKEHEQKPRRHTKNVTKAERVPLWTRDFVLIIACNLLVFMAFHSVPAAIPLYLNDLGAPAQLVGFAVSATTLSSIVLRPLIGVGTDRFGRRVFFVGGIIAMALSLFTLSLIPSAIYVIILRITHGFAWASVNNSASTIAADIVPRARFGEGIGYFSLSSSISLAIAPAAALLIMSLADFTVVVLLGSVLIALAFTFSFFVRYETPQQQAREYPRLSFAEMFNKAAIIPATVAFFSNMVYGSVLAFVALLAAERAVDNIAFFFVIYAIGVMLSRPNIGKMVDRLGYLLPVLLGCSMLFAGVVCVIFAYNIWIFLLAALCFGVGQGSMVAAMQTMAVADAPYRHRGAATSTFFIGFDAGIGTGSLLAGTIAGVAGYTATFEILLAAPVVALTIYLLFGRRQERKGV